MKLPVKSKDDRDIIDDNNNWVCFANTTQGRDQIVQAINSYEKRYREGYEAGLRAYAWWKDDVEYVGSCGTTLEQALKEAEKK